jgi:hypothetical protein
MKDSHLPVLPESFWKICQGVSDSWDSMNLILDHEWEALKGRDLKGLLKLSRAKHILAGQISVREKQMIETVERLLGACGIRDTDSRWAALRMLVNTGDLRKLNEWKWQYDASRNRAVATNSRLHKWITEQMESSAELAALLAGRKKSEPLTYSPGITGKKFQSSHTNNFRHSAGGADGAFPSEDVVRSVISSYREIQQPGSERSAS